MRFVEQVSSYLCSFFRHLNDRRKVKQDPQDRGLSASQLKSLVHLLPEEGRVSYPLYPCAACMGLREWTPPYGQKYCNRCQQHGRGARECVNPPTTAGLLLSPSFKQLARSGAHGSSQKMVPNEEGAQSETDVKYGSMAAPHLRL